MSKNHHFTYYDVALLFWVFSKLVGGYVKIFKVHYSCNIKETCVPCNILFTELNLDKKNNKDMA